MRKWYEEAHENHQGVIISSRIRLARNLKDYPFPNRAVSKQSQEVLQVVGDAVKSSQGSLDRKYNQLLMTDVSRVDKIAMMEMHIISPNFVKVQRPSALILREDEAISIMVNEEDHIRIQSMKSGMDLLGAMASANEVDDLFETKVDYAFDSRLGYLTACPTNLGTGLRASYMIHVPALETTGQLQLILDAIGKFGLIVRGIYGEGSEAQGSVFQVSNQVTLGMTEAEIIENLSSVTKQIVEQELMVRQKLLNEKRHRFEDAVFRSYGILSHARMITSKEAMTMLSDMKLGIELGIVKTEGNTRINIYSLMSKIQPANLQIMHNRQLNADERDMARAEYLRQQLPKVING